MGGPSVDGLSGRKGSSLTIAFNNHTGYSNRYDPMAGLLGRRATQPRKTPRLGSASVCALLSSAGYFELFSPFAIRGGNQSYSNGADPAITDGIL